MLDSQQMLTKTPRLPGKTLVIGAKGFIGRAFFDAYRQLYPDTIGTHHNAPSGATSLSFTPFNLLESDLADLKIRKGVYEYALIAAGNTNLTTCELQKLSTFEINVTGILRLVKNLIRMEIQPILFSTAYVFDGKFGNYTELSKTNPINEYGKQKEYIENEIKNICGDYYLLIRTSKIFDILTGGSTLIDEIYSKLHQGKQIYAAYDQIFSPLHVNDLVKTVLELQSIRGRGLYNICSQEKWSRLELARELCKVLSLDTQLVTPISLDQIKRDFQMPKRATLSIEKLHQTLLFKPTLISKYLEQLQTSV
jgi:dTDP-4-dehydrorhamnose reductase